ncbi:MDR/zinc-dependent alcohol dehydrogenase-like family protein [Verrucomicrobiota bacterium sgz303538]
MPTLSQPAPTASVHTGTMRAAVITAPQKLELQEVPIPEPGPHQVRVRLEGCGVCASNIPPWEGRPWFHYPMEPGALGHEGYGVIDTVGSEVIGWNAGDRVAMLSYHAYAEYDIADVDSIVRLPEALAEYPFPAEPLACAMNIFSRCQIEAGQTVAIIGVGFLGALLTQMATRAGARVVAITRRRYAKDVAREMGAQEVIAMDDHYRIIEQVKEMTNERFCDVAIEAVGKQWPLDLAGELTRERGRLVVAGYHQDGPRQVNMQLWNWRGLDVINAHERDPQIYTTGMERAVEAVQYGRLEPSSLYTHRFSLDQLGAALEMTCERPDGFMKAIISL